MDPMRVLADQRGFFTTADARERGYDDRAVAEQVRSGAWTRFRRGAFAFADQWATQDDEQRHLVRARAVLRSLGSRVALSHVSAALAHGVQVTGIDLGRVHVTRLDAAAGRVEGDVVHHEGHCLTDEVVEVDGMRAVPAVRAALEAGSRAHGGPCLAVLDSLLHQGLATHEELIARYATMQRWPFMRPLQISVRMADGRAASPGESLGRHLFWTGGLPAPQLQYPVHDDVGRLVGTSDWGWPDHALLGEFDGRVKYGRLVRPGQTPGEVVFAEKRREDEMREVTSFGMVRLVWQDYLRPRLTLQRVARQLGLTS